MKVALSFLACLLVANAAVLPQNGLGVTKGEIDTLIKDAALMYRNAINKIGPVKAASFEIPIKIEGLNVKVTEPTVWTGDDLKYSEWSSLSDDELDLSVELGMGIGGAGKLQVTGTSQGKLVDQQGSIAIITPTFGKKLILKAQLTPDSVTLVDADTAPEIDDVLVIIKEIEIDGVSKADLESAIAEAVKDYYIESEEQSRKQLPELLKQLNQFIGKHNLQEVYNFLRKLVPSS